MPTPAGEPGPGDRLANDGIDAARLTDWLTGVLPTARAPFEFHRLAGGRSNITVRVSDADGGSWILRRPPTIGVLPSAHDMSREHRILTALVGSAVPAPLPVALCEEPTVTGAPFYLMEDVAGLVVRDQADASRLEPRARSELGQALAMTLAAIHAVDASQPALAAMDRGPAFGHRQLRRLGHQLSQSATRPLPLADEMRASLADRLPTEHRRCLMHGDYRLDNVVVSPEGAVRSVLDWELCTIGDPLADLGLLCVYWLDPGEEVIPRLSSPTHLTGFPRRAELVERYVAHSGADVSDLPAYVAFGFWKLAVILEGVYSRFRSGAYRDDLGGYEVLGSYVPRLLERSRDALAEPASF